MSDTSTTFDCMLRGEPNEQLDIQYPFYPLTAPGMPLPGDNFLRNAMALGDQPPVYSGTGKHMRLVSYGAGLAYLYRRALYDEAFYLNVDLRGSPKTAQLVPGHLYGADTANLGGGPMHARVMLIGKNPGRDEVQFRRNLVGPTSSILVDALDQLGVSEAERNSWYVTNLVKWPALDAQSDTLPTAHKKDCQLLLEQELRLVRPDYILCLGSDASNWLLNFGVQSLVGRCLDYTIPLHMAGEEPRMHVAKVMAVVHPAQVSRRPEMFEEFKSQVGLFLSLTNGAEIGGRELWVNHRDVYKARELAAIVDEIRADPDPWRRVIAVDAEWNGVHPGEPGAYLRTIQFSSKHGEGINVVLRHQGGAPAFQPSIGHAIAELRRLLKYDAEAGWFPRVGGHFFRADSPWLISEGLDLRAEYKPAPTPALCREFGGWDTGLAYHAYNESTSYRLTDMQVRLTTAPVYDDIIKEAVTDFCKEHDISKDDLEGYGFIPAWKLHPYAAYDPDVTRRIIVKHVEPGGLLDKDWFDNSSWEPFWRSHRASIGVLEMEMTGLMLDKPRVDELSGLYEYVHAQLLADFRQKINWPTFNPDSPQQAVAFLFGDSYSRKINPAGGFMSPRPADALSLNLTPIKSTGKRPRLWADLVHRGEERSYSPSTDKETLGIVGHAHPLAMHLRDLKFIAQILKGPLRRPVRDDATGLPQVDDDGNRMYAAGLASYVLSDGRLHTHLSMNKETGRMSSARPALQNLSSRRETDYARILGSSQDGAHMGAYKDLFPQPMYRHPVRSIFRAGPDCVLVGADYKGAELAMLAWLSGDPTLIEHVRRNSLEEDHRDFFDIHANMAVRCFHLDCEPTKKGLKKIGKPQLRIAAKCVVAGSRLHTSSGFIRVEDLVDVHPAADTGVLYNGELSVANHCSTTPVIGFYNGGVKPCIRVETERGYSLESTYEHNYWVMDGSGRLVFRRAGDLRLGDWLCVRTTVGPFGDDVGFPMLPIIPRTSHKPINFPREMTEDWAAFMGLYAAEGSANPVTGQMQLSLAHEKDSELRDKAAALLRRLFGDRVLISPVEYDNHYQDATRFVVMSVDLARWLAVYVPGQAITKQLSEFVFRWPQRLIASFLRWLCAGDGSVKLNGNGFVLTYNTASVVLAEQVKQLFLLCGITVTHAKESREGYDNTYHVLSVFGNQSRNRYLASIGLVIASQRERCRKTVSYELDHRVIPHQVRHLKAILKAVKSPTKEKCRECVRERSRISFSPTRLALIMGKVDYAKLDDAGQRAYAHLAALPANDIEFQQVTSLLAIGDKQVYDVQTTDEQHHLVSYNGLLTHQTVIFGIPYGRAADAIARACREEGVTVSIEECQAIINFYHEQYATASGYLRTCGERSQDQRWIAGAHGRYRRFIPSRDRAVSSEQRRQAQNFPEQNGVADTVYDAIFNFCEIRREFPDVVFRLVLQMHDALLFEVPVKSLNRFYVDDRDEAGTITRPSILRECMVNRCPVWPRYLDNTPMPVQKPYFFGIDADLYVNWGEAITEQQAAEMGIAPAII